MKLNATINMKVMNLFDEERNVTVRTRSYTIVNEEDLRNALKRMRPDVETRILDMALYQSGLIISNINNIHIMYNKYNPTSAGAPGQLVNILNFQNGLKRKRHVSILKIKMTSVLNILLSVDIVKLVIKHTLKRCFITRR